MQKIATAHIISVAYFIAGLALIITTTQSKYVPIHASLVGMLNVIASCGIYGRRKWSLYMVVFISIISFTFGSMSLVAMIYNFSHDISSILALLGMASYIVLTIISLAYVIMRKGNLLMSPQIRDLM
ncbi:MAG: hypothetical protein QXH24_03330 [Candidatus Bathyarchaeia archaeon]